jgi:transcriptional regulator with PAS, ATPase and Fis domain
MMTKGIPFLPSAISLVMKQLPNVMQEQNLQSSESHKDKGPGKKLALKKMATEVWKEFRKEKFQDQLSLFSERFVLEYDEKAGRTTFSKKTALELRIKYLRDIYGSIKSPKEWNFIRQQAPESEIKAVHEIESHFPTFKKIVSKDPAINHIKIQLAHNARFGNDGLDVLLMGETGTGKELFAEAVHEATQKASKRKGEYRRVNCAAISETLLESELFGHKKGTFTGAKENRDGYFKVANGGTLLLDEVGELSLNSQAKLLRVIQQREIQTVGASKPEKIDVVVVFATNKNLKEMVKQGKFREDLYHRINSYTYVIPPLRERKHDIPILIEYFITKFDTQRGENPQIEPLQVTEQCMEYFTKHQWPGNVRELENIVRRIVRERREGERRNIELAELPDELVEEVRKDKGTEAEDLTQENLPGSQKVTDDQIKVWMEKLGGDKSKVARKLGVTYKTILRHCQKLGI